MLFFSLLETIMTWWTARHFLSSGLLSGRVVRTPVFLFVFFDPPNHFYGTPLAFYVIVFLIVRASR